MKGCFDIFPMNGHNIDLDIKQRSYVRFKLHCPTRSEGSGALAPGFGAPHHLNPQKKKTQGCLKTRVYVLRFHYALLF